MKVKAPFSKLVEAKQHSPAYMMHRYFARRPYNVFSELIKHYTEEGDIILDPFCGGGVTVVEGLLLKRKVIGTDINPLATFVTEMEIAPLSTDQFLKECNSLKERVQPTMDYLYSTHCPHCSNSTTLFGTKIRSYFDWIEWDNGMMIRCKYRCEQGHSGEKKPDKNDFALAQEIEINFEKIIKEQKLWYPQQSIPNGDKTDSLLQKGYDCFWQLFTKRNLIALSILRKEILKIEDSQIQKFLLFALSGTLKWASKQSHLRGDVVEGWAMHAYWIYPRSLEINVWETLIKRCKAIVRGKEYLYPLSNYYKTASVFDDMSKNANTMILNQSSDNLPLPDDSIDAIITDPPYGGNVNYGELADYWLVWLDGICSGIMDKRKEAVINTTQGKALKEYEEILSSVFKECYRVLKDGGLLVATFNSKDLIIISSFVKATVSAGFQLMNNGLLYQPPIKAYVTTVHAKEVGAFTGDFIFTFYKERNPKEFKKVDKSYCRDSIDEIVGKYTKKAKTEIQLRKWVYEEIIPLFAEWVKSPGEWINEVARYAELQIKKQKFEDLHFKQARSIAR
jgi:ubiquinone/menaquinone biosynthesis C-methylase UbiE